MAAHIIGALFDGVKTAAEVLVKAGAPVVWEGIKGGYQVGKATGEVVKETAKGAVEGVKAVGKGLVGD